MFLSVTKTQTAEAPCWCQYDEAAHLCVYNVLLSGLPMSNIRLLQRVLNAEARLALGLSPRDHVRAALQKLHWLPVTHRIQYKLALIMFLMHGHQCPDYMSNSVTQCHWSVMILDVGDAVQLPVLITTFRALEPNTETGRSRSPVQKRGTTYMVSPLSWQPRQFQAKS